MTMFRRIRPAEWRLIGLCALVVIMLSVLTVDAPSKLVDHEGKDQPLVVPIVAGSVRYTDRHVLDVNAPRSPQRALPVVVLVHACCGDRADLGRLAETIAGAGAVTMNADWAGIKPGTRFPDAYAGVACAVRFARARAADYGGDPENVTLLGWADGAMVSAVVAARGDWFDRVRCRHPKPSAVPDAVVGVAGFYGWTLPVGQVYVNDRARAFLGGTPRTAPRAWHDATPYGWLNSAEPRCITLLVGATDPLLEDAERFAAALRGSGHAPRVVVAPAGGDQSMISPRTEEGLTTVREALSATSRCRPS